MYRVCQSVPSTIDDFMFAESMFVPAHSYNHYVELVEPADKRACIKCCDNFDDCPLDKGAFAKLLSKQGRSDI